MATERGTVIVWSKRHERRSADGPSPEPYNPFLAASAALAPTDPAWAGDDTSTAPLPLVAGLFDSAAASSNGEGPGLDEPGPSTTATVAPQPQDVENDQIANVTHDRQEEVEWTSIVIPEPMPIPAWGAAPAPVPAGGYRLAPMPLATPRHSRKVQVAPARARSGVSRLLTTVRPKDRRPEALSVVRNPWIGRKRVVVGSLFGGAGTTSTVVALHGAARVLGVQAAVLDASSGWWPGASGWADKSDVVATSWPEVLQTSPDERVARFHAAVGGDGVGRGGAGWAKSLVIGDGMATRADRPTAVEASQIAGETSQAWPLTILEIGGGHQAVTTAVTSTRPQLLVMSCRASVDQLQATLDYLRWLTTEESFDTQHCAVIAVHQQRTAELAAELRPLRAQVVDAAAGLVTIGWIAGGRPAPISPQRVSDQGLMLLAAAALAIDNTDTDTAGTSQYRSVGHLSPPRPTP